MNGKRAAIDVDVDLYFTRLRENVVFAELALMQLVAITKQLEERETLNEELRVNLEIQEHALKDMLVLSIARIFDRKGKRQDQLSLPNILESKRIDLTQNQKAELQQLASLPTVKKIRDVRDQIVAHSLADAADMVLPASDIMPIIDGCYAIIAEIYKHNRPSGFLERKDISAFSAKWSEMTESWR